MLSTTVSNVPPMNPRTVMTERDRYLALEYARAGEPPKGKSQLAKQLGVDRKVLERAVARQIEWARCQLSDQSRPPTGEGVAT
jgi:hypothetical protein